MPSVCFPGDHYRGPPADLNQEPDEEWVKSLQDEGKAYQEWDEDADVDESGELPVSLMYLSGVHLIRSSECIV